MSVLNKRQDLTPDQLRGVKTVGRSLLLSAAAGSGKTRVLSERCAYLVCDAPAAVRCDVSELLVVTFTEAAATEMRGRIGKALQDRAAVAAENPRLQKQIALVDQAQISTLHGFCSHLLRQHFHRVGLDPAFSVMDEHEAVLLRLDVGRELLRQRYAVERPERFRKLLDGYFYGDDERLLDVILRIHNLCGSLISPDEWILATLHRTEESAREPLQKSQLGRALLASIKQRITTLGQSCNGAIAALQSLGSFPGYVSQIEQIRDICRFLYKEGEKKEFNWLVEYLNDIKLDSLKPVASTVPNKVPAKEIVDAVVKEFKEGKWRTLLRFTSEECQDGMSKVLPHVRELLELVERFNQDYREAKDNTHQLDFSDLERFALTVLRDETQPGVRPSAVARHYHRAFKYVLVDEFQDINAVQNAILRLLSHECLADTDGARAGDVLPPNLFCVGDVKQSIYRFRLADPQQFLEREAALRNGGNRGEVIDLQQNFRSRGPLLEAINAIFGRLMTKESAELAYDQTQQLVPARDFGDSGMSKVFPGAPIELHLLPSKQDAPASSTAGEDEAADDFDRTENEALFVAQRIREIVGNESSPGYSVFDRESKQPRPARYSDIVILLRSQKYKANDYVRVLNDCGVPTHVVSGSGFFEAQEIRDISALLTLLDNQAQDLPLAAYLRSPLSGLKNCEDALATVHIEFGKAESKVPFHDAVVRYAAERTDALAVQLRDILDRLSQLREQANRQPAHETIWAIYQTTGYLTYVAGLPGGPQRSANLMDLYERARIFANHRRQGLSRFLDYLRTLEADADLGQASVVSSSEDAVSIKTVHASKGLEFPIVFLPDLGKKINTRDEAGPVLLDRDLGIALPVADEALFAMYPSLAQSVVKESIHQKLIAEELRVLYVALTRAMEHLILVGTISLQAPEKWLLRWKGHTGPLPTAAITQATSVLDWVGPVWATNEGTARQVIELSTNAIELLPKPPASRDRQKLSVPAGQYRALKPLVAAAEMTPEDQLAVNRLQFVYPFERFAHRVAVKSVTALAQSAEGYVSQIHPTAPGLADATPTLLELPEFVAANAPLAASERGTATHVAMQHLRFSDALDHPSINRQVAAMVACRQLTTAQSLAVDVAAIGWFLGTDLGQKIRENEVRVIREMPVYVAESLADDSDAVGLDAMMVRGRCDLFLPLAADGVIIDYKTDAIRSEAQLADRVTQYQVQLGQYARAIERVVGHPVRQGYLVFFKTRQVIAVDLDA